MIEALEAAQGGLPLAWPRSTAQVSIAEIADRRLSASRSPEALATFLAPIQEILAHTRIIKRRKWHIAEFGFRRSQQPSIF